MVRDTRDSFTIGLRDVFVQAASCEGDAVLVDTAGDRFLAAGCLTPEQHEELIALGFTRPDDEMPNWWIDGTTTS